MSSAETARALTGTWRGTYACAQGATGIDVVFGPGSGADRLDGTFRFYPVPSNPNVPRGCFRVTATAIEGGRVRTSAGAWVTQPPDYQTANIEGRINTDGTLSRDILPRGMCGGFLLRRTEAAPEPC